MQYHLNGFRAGDPAVFDAIDDNVTKPGKVDVLIVGSGPAGLTLAAQLSAFPQITTRIAECKGGPLKVGQADGIACRSIEMFNAFGFSENVLKEGYWVNEVVFWKPGKNDVGLNRADRIEDVEDDLSEMPHVILNQARVHDFFLETMRHGPRRLEPDYNRELVALTYSSDARYPVTATFKCLETKNETETVRARFVVGCDGARSTVRHSMGHALDGDATRQLWGVMDSLLVTDFPDIRLKAVVQSADQGSILIIPREGGYMVRMYVEMDELRGSERAADRNMTSDILIEKARAILAPFTLDVKEVVWWSAYEIGQRVCDAFDDVPEQEPGTRVPHIFIAGDACHTHSPKAGQGMNVSMADTFNLGWKLAAVLRGQAASALLRTYSYERRAIAKELIDFDRDMARLISARPDSDAQTDQFRQYFKKHGRYTAGVEARYEKSLITGSDQYQSLAKGFNVGMRFHSAPVVRLADARPIHLGHTLKADGRWRLVAFAQAGDKGQSDRGIGRLCQFLSNHPDSPVTSYTPAGADVDSVIDICAVFQSSHRGLKLEDMPDLLVPAKGVHGLTDYEKVFCPDFKNGPDIFDHRGIDRNEGALLILRPDQFVAQVLPLDAMRELSAFFDGFMLPVATS